MKDKRSAAPAAAGRSSGGSHAGARKRWRPGFAFYLLLFTVFALAVIFSLFVLLKEWVAKYDRELPRNVMQRYVDGFGEEDLRRVAAPFLEGLDRNLESPEESFAEVQALMDGTMTFVKNPAECSERDLCYVMRIGGQDIGKVRLHTDGDVSRKYSTAHWTLAGEEYDFSMLLKSGEVTAADCWRVFFNGRELGEEYLVRGGIPYPELADYYDRFPALPRKCVYAVDSFAAGHAFTVETVPGAGQLPADQVPLDEVLDRCSEEDRTAIADFCADYAARYVRFSANAGGGDFGTNCAWLRQLILPGTNLYQRLAQSQESLSYTGANYSQVESVELRRAMALDGSTFLVEMTYICSTGRDSTHIRSANDLTLVLVRTDSGKLLAETMLVQPARVLEAG